MELRRMIYSILLVKNNPLICTNCRNSGFGLGPAEEHGPILDVAILATSKQVYQEAREEFLLKATFRINDINVARLMTSEAQRHTLRQARNLIVLFEPHRHGYQDKWIFDYEFPQFRHLENLYVVLYFHLAGASDKGFGFRNHGTHLLEPWRQLWVGKTAKIEWRDVDKTNQTPGYLQERKNFEEYLANLAKDMVKGRRPDGLYYQWNSACNY